MQVPALSRPLGIYQGVEAVSDAFRDSATVSTTASKRIFRASLRLLIPPKFSRESLDTLDWNWPTLQASGLRDYVDHARDYWQALVRKANAE